MHNNKETSDIFNNFFTSIAGKIRSNIRPSVKPFKDYLTERNSNKFCFRPCTADEIIKLIQNLKNGKASGPNSIPISILIFQYLHSMSTFIFSFQ